MLYKINSENYYINLKNSDNSEKFTETLLSELRKWGEEEFERYKPKYLVIQLVLHNTLLNMPVSYVYPYENQDSLKYELYGFYEFSMKNDVEFCILNKYSYTDSIYVDGFHNLDLAGPDLDYAAFYLLNDN